MVRWDRIRVLTRGHDAFDFNAGDRLVDCRMGPVRHGYSSSYTWPKDPALLFDHSQSGSISGAQSDYVGLFYGLVQP